MAVHPTSFRPSPDLDGRLTAMAARVGVSKSALLQVFAEEGERSRRYPGIAFRGPEHRRRAWVVGGGGDVWEIIRTWKEFNGDEATMIAEVGVPATSLRIATAYYREFRDEIEALIAVNRRDLDEWQRDYPFAQTVSTPNKS